MSYYFKSENSVLRDEQEDAQSRMKTDCWIFILLLLAIAIVPLIVGGHVENIVAPYITNIDLLNAGLKVDIFTHYKMIILLILTVVSLALLLMKVFFMNGEIRNSKINIFIIIFAISISISTILSPTVSIALWGQYNRSDGAISYICYLTLFFVAMNIEYPKNAIQYIMYSLYPFILVNFILITMNFSGYDAMNYKVVEKTMSLFLPSGATLEEGSSLLGTLNQWNFMSGMFAVLTIMYLAWAIIDTHMIRSFLNIGVAVITFAIMLMSVSTSGFLTIIVLIPFLIALLLKCKNSKKTIIALLVFLIINIPVFHMLADKNPRVWDESIGVLLKKNPYIKEQPVAIKSNEFKILLENKVYAAENHFELPELPERDVSAGSGRAYIWQKTIDLAMERPLFGFGLDTLMYHFPHYNIDARAGMWDENKIVDKPHSMYVGIFYGTGIVGTIGFAGIVILTVFAAMRVVIRRKQSMVAVLAVGWLAFLFQALFNDSLPGTSGVYWTLAGMMIGMTFINNDNEEKIDGRID
ncbi:O-antigen ligase family protein [Sporosarcina koreensis]|uniref:O-antigen ligase family protein n=1 Tax=Sporosarcina koreensis TaxID=334735 RepID=UPI00075D2F76|nr:O-antigen ligase family protein [Sporosarcina koreensis]